MSRSQGPGLQATNWAQEFAPEAADTRGDWADEFARGVAAPFGGDDATVEDWANSFAQVAMKQLGLGRTLIVASWQQGVLSHQPQHSLVMHQMNIYLKKMCFLMVFATVPQHRDAY